MLPLFLELLVRYAYVRTSVHRFLVCFGGFFFFLVLSELSLAPSGLMDIRYITRLE